MEIKILKEEKNKIEFEVIGEDHTLCNPIRSELWNRDNVNISAYNIKHPLVGSQIMLVEVSKGDPKTAISDSISSLKKQAKELRDLFSKKL